MTCTAARWDLAGTSPEVTDSSRGAKPFPDIDLERATTLIASEEGARPRHAPIADVRAATATRCHQAGSLTRKPDTLDPSEGLIEFSAV
jgi:hypothetical protein